MSPVTIAYITSRDDCKVQWFCDSLAKQAAEDLDEVQVIFIDRLLWALTPEAGNLYWRRGDLFPIADPVYHREARREVFEKAVDGRFDFLHLPPKPNMVQGPFRLTNKDWFTAAQARNTAIIAALHDYVVFVDDLSVLLSSWWPQVKHAAEHKYVVCGQYKKVKALCVEDGSPISWVEFPAGVDSRWARGNPNGIVPCNGHDLYGCSFGAPLELLLRVNGNEEATDAQAAEDYDLGIRLERAGGKFFLNQNMTTFESEEGHHSEPSLPREMRIMPADRLPAGYAGRPDSDHVILWRVRNENRVTTLAQWTNLRRAREEFLASKRVMIPTHPTEDWRNGQPLKEL